MVIRKLLILFLIMVFFVMPVSAFKDDFNDADITDWNIISGTWYAKNTSSQEGSNDYYINNYSHNTGTGTITAEISKTVSDFSYLEFDIRPDSEINLNGGSSGTIDTYSRIYFSDTDYIDFHNKDTGVSQIEISGFSYIPVAYTPDEWYHVEVTFYVNGNVNIDVYYDGAINDTQTTTYTHTNDGTIKIYNRIVNNLYLAGSYATTSPCIDNIITSVLESSIGDSSVSWDQDPYYTGEMATITTDIDNFDDGTYSYYLDIYNTNDYLTTFELTSETESNYYTFPLSWTDTSLLAKLVRVTDPYATNEVQLAYDISHFETLDWDTTVSFNRSSYNPSDVLKVTWSGAADGSSVWLRAGDDGEVIESDVAYSGSFTFNIPTNTTETYYIVDVATGGYSQAQASCIISSIPDFFFNYSVAVDQDEYVHGDWVNVTYSTNEPAVIKIFDDTNADIWHYLDVPAAVTNETWMYYIGDTDPYGSFSVLFGNDNFLVSDYYSVVSSTSFVEVIPESMFMYDTMTIWYITNGSSTLSITDWWDSILLNQTVNSSSLESISYAPTASGKLTITLSDVPVDATDSIIVYWAADPDDVSDDDDVIEDDVIEDVLDDDESMTDYFEGKFREFAPTAWGIFLLSIILWLMAILVSFSESGKRR